MIRTMMRRLDVDVLFAHLAFWYFIALSIVGVGMNVAHFGEVTTMPADANWWSIFSSLAFFYLALSIIRECSLVPWRTPMILLLAAGVLYDMLVLLVVGYETRDLNRFFLDFVWMLGLMSLYKFRPIRKEEC